MFLISKEVICPNCGTKGSIIIYSKVFLDPELQKKMDNGELFIWKCPKCEKKYICIGLSLNISEERLKELGLSGIIRI